MIPTLFDIAFRVPPVVFLTTKSKLDMKEILKNGYRVCVQEKAIVVLLVQCFFAENIAN